MAHTRYLNAWTVTVCLAFVAGCGDAGDAPQAAETPEIPETTQTPEPPANTLPLSISVDGALHITGGQAQLTVRQDADHATLTIGGGSGGEAVSDHMYITLAFPISAAVLGAHVSELGLPRERDNVAQVFFDENGETQFSRSGLVDFTLSSEKQISGSFSFSLSAVNEANGNFEAVGETTDVSGTFSGSYEVMCYSVLAGHSIALTPDPTADFCRALDL